MAKELKKKIAATIKGTKATRTTKGTKADKNPLTRTVAKLKKTVVAVEKKIVARKKPAAKPRPLKIAPAKDPVISSGVGDIDASQSAKFTLETAAAPQPRAVKPKVPEYEDLGELPEAYGTKKLYLVARDPHWLYAYWDLTPDQIGAAEREAHDGKVFLQVYSADGERLHQIHISPWTREWYLGAHRPEGTFYAEVGYYRRDGGFEAVTRSAPATTPRAGLSWRTEARFATIPFTLSFSELADIIRDHAKPGEEIAETLARLQDSGFPLPFKAAAIRQLSGAAHRALLDYINGDLTRRVRLGSEEIVETVRRRRDAAVDLDLAELSSGQWSSPSSPFGGYGAERGFHAHVNAELIIYGGTAPDATVSVAGEKIKLTASGAFHYHFNFKDGSYHLPIIFTSADGAETRAVTLDFTRATQRIGAVTDTPQAPRPEPPRKTGGF
ncbi:MAG: DUF4912 domain-containing protein [Verrucomicrobiales bacterium]|jgi:hypothetical protein|nr:DUF4912 domain-containing protein [Verrucomicrobiales bacterium]